MELALSNMISAIDEYAVSVLDIPERVLMKRSGEAVADAVRELVTKGSHVAIFVGKGNNGGDGYAAACELIPEYSVTVYDVFGEGQRSEAGKYFLNEFQRLGGRIFTLPSGDKLTEEIKDVHCIVDAVFGTGFSGRLSDSVRNFSDILRASNSKKVAVDIPLGVNADDGTVSENALAVDITVALSYIKPGIVSYPARAYIGKINRASLGLPREKLLSRFRFSYFLTDDEWAKEALPKREDNTSKGSFGRALLITGSEKYRGAAYLSLEAALRGGVGRVSFAGYPALTDELIAKFPEAIYRKFDINGNNKAALEEIVGLSREESVTLIGSGSSSTEELFELVRRLLSTEGGALILDADAINALSTFGGAGLIKSSPRTVILTPHPLEFSRLSGLSVNEIQSSRISVAKSYARENNCILLLKGAATVITDGEVTYINGSGSSALAKAGSGDVLAGFTASLLAQGKSPLESVALAAYIHGRAGDNLAEELSSYGVTVSDLPKEIARILSELEKRKSENSVTKL